MKNKFLGKLILSGAALAACATTLVTSTYAWYTSNTEVTASGVEGESSANGDSLLLISTTGENGTYSNSVTLSLTSESLLPVQYTAGDADANYIPTFNGWDGGGVASIAAGNGSYLAFDLYFRGVSGDSGVSVNLNKLVLKNTTTELPKKDVLSTTGLPNNWNIGTNAVYSVDILRTINIAYVSYQHNGSVSDTADAKQQTGNLDPEALTTLKTDSLSADGATFSAINYLNAVTGKNIELPADYDSPTKMAPGSQITFGKTPNSTATNNALHVKFYVYIDGWDLACFDAIQGQTISLNLGFTSDPVSTIVTV